MKIILIAILQILFISINYAQTDQEKVEFMDQPTDAIPKNKYGDTIIIEGTSYSYIKSVGNLLVLKTDENMGVFDLNFNPILAPTDIQSIKLESYGIRVITDDGRYGLFDKNGKELIPPKMKFISLFYDGVIDYTNENGKKKLYFLSKGYHSKADFCDIKGFSMENYQAIVSLDCENYAIVHLDSIDHVPTFDIQNPKYIYFDNKSGWILTRDNKKGVELANRELVLPFEYDEIQNIRNFFIVKKNTLWGIVDKENQELVSIKYETIESLNKDKFLVRLNDKIGLINIDNEILISIDYESLKWNYQRNIFYGKRNGKMGVISPTGIRVIPIEYSSIEDNLNDGYIVKLGDKSGVVSYTGKEIIPINYYQINLLRADYEYMEVGYHVLNKNLKSSFFDISGQQKTEFVFDDYEIHGRRQPIKVKIGNLTFYVNAHGACVKDCPSDLVLKEFGLKSKL